MLEEGSKFKLVLEFFDESESYALGFEAGQVYRQTETRKSFDGTYHAKNVEQFLAIAKAKDYRCTPTNSDGHWCNLKFEPINKGFINRIINRFLSRSKNASKS